LHSFNLISVFTHFPVDEALQVIQTKLNLEHTAPQWSYQQTRDVMDLLEVCETAV
jgi:hypothetical protein